MRLPLARQRAAGGPPRAIAALHPAEVGARPDRDPDAWVFRSLDVAPAV